MLLTKSRLKQIIKEELAVLEPTEEDSPTSTTEVVFTTLDGDVAVQAELVTTDEKIAQGLMFRKKPLGDNKGMLFDFHEEGDRAFYMKNTFIPLDMIFINNDKEIVGIVEKAQPLSLETRGVNAAARYVLEMDGGWTKRHNIEIGQTVHILS